MTSRASILLCSLTLALLTVNAHAADIRFWSADGDYALCHLDIPAGESRTWLIVADTDGINGITQAEFRVTGWPTGYINIVTPNPGATVLIGDPFGSGCNIAFACEASAIVPLFTIETTNLGAGVAGAIAIDQHTTPSNVSYQCPVLTDCNLVVTSACVPGATAYVNQGTGTPPADPVPADASTEVAVNAQLGWSSGHPGNECAVGIAEHRVFFGTDADPPLVGTVSPLDNTVFDPGALIPGTTYYWRIEAIDTGFGISGPLWSFTTEATVAVADRNWDQVKQLYR